VAHVSLITLGVDDLRRATGFYTALGWDRSGASVDGVVAFLAGGTVALALYGREALAADAGVTLSPAPSAVALAVNLPSEADVDALLATAVAAGGTVTKPAARADWGGYSGYVTDPDGHLWEVAHNPGFPLDGDGRVTLP
jgi:predicted lactoylglutathione lyase